MISTGDHFGTFWLAGGTESPGRIDGVLSIADDGTTSLKMHAEVANGLVEVSREQLGDVIATTSRMRREDEVEQFTILGELPEANEQVTLLFAQPTGQSQRMGGRVHDPGREWLSCRWAIIGVHLDGPDSTFAAVRFRTTHLDEWASVSQFSRIVRPRGDGDGAILAHVTRDAPPVVGEDGVRVQLTWEMTVGAPHLSSVTASSETFLEVDLAGVEHDWIHMQSRVVSPLVAFLSLAVGEEVGVLACEVKDATGRWCNVVGHGLLGADTSRSHTRDKMPAPPGALRLEGLAAVIQPATVEKMGPIPIVLAHYQNGGSATVETEALELCTIAEGIHARLFAGERRLSRPVAKQARNAAMAAVETGDVRDAVREALGHLGDMSYSQRIGSLAEDTEAVAPGVAGPSELRSTWVRAVVSTRNEFAHRPTSRGFLAETDIDRFLVVTESLRWLLKLLLLRYVTLIPAKALTERLGGLQPYEFAAARIARSLRQLVPVESDVEQQG